MDSFAKISGNLENFRALFPLWTLPECICSTVFDPLVDCRMHSCNCIKRKLHYIHFSGTFPKFSAQLFQISLMKSSVAEFSTVLGGRLLFRVILKSESTRDNFSKFLYVKLSPQKSLWWISILVATSNIFKNRLVHSVLLHVIVKNILFKARSYGLQFW